MSTSNQTITVCILAYNEQTHIENSIKNIIEGNKDIKYSLKVYANGCTDNTVQIVKNLEKIYPNLEAKELNTAGKPNAWNTAFAENKTDILMFSDADIIVEAGSIKTLSDSLVNNKEMMASTAQYTPFENGLSFQKKFTGFMQLPIEQEYLTGHFYAIRRAPFDEIFKKYNIDGIPKGLVGEDYFIDLLIPEGKLVVTDKKCFYEPGTIEEYAKYFARIRWQNQQMQNVFEKLNIDCEGCFVRKNTFILLKEKWGHSRNRLIYLSRLISAVFRHIFLFLYKNRINTFYEALGPVIEKGNHILRETRSDSTK